MLDPDRKVPHPAPRPGAASRAGFQALPGLLLVGAILLGAAACGDAHSESDDGSVRMIPAAGAESAGDGPGDADGASLAPDGEGRWGPESPGTMADVQGDVGDAGDAGDAHGEAGRSRPRVEGSGEPSLVEREEGNAPPSRPRTERREPVDQTPVDRAPEPEDLERTDRGGMTLHFPSGPEARGPNVPAGTRFEAVMETGLSTGESRAGDAFRARLDDDVIAGDGLVLLPRGSVVRGRVAESRESDASDRPAVIRLVVESVVVDGRTYDVTGTVVDAEMTAEARESSGRTATKVGVGAAAGAVLGKILGGDNRDAVKGAVAGAAAGAAVALATRGGHATIAEGARVVVRLERPLVLGGSR